jgi:hypothetical protein
MPALHIYSNHADVLSAILFYEDKDCHQMIHANLAAVIDRRHKQSSTPHLLMFSSYPSFVQTNIKSFLDIQ